MDIVVKGRNVEVPEHYRVHVDEKMARVERYDSKVIRYDVELYHEPNRRQSKSCQRVEITGKGRGPAIRAEACGPDFYAALDVAVAKLESRLRRACDRRKVHHGRRHPISVAEATAPLAAVLPTGNSAPAPAQPGAAPAEGPAEQPADAAADGAGDLDLEMPTQRWDDGVQEHLPGRIVRRKEHPAEPMTVDQALYEMELVGHDFFLFSDAASARPSVVYRRKGFDYGVIQLT